LSLGQRASRIAGKNCRSKFSLIFVSKRLLKNEKDYIRRRPEGQNLMTSGKPI
jgi:hypothetical protein